MPKWAPDTEQHKLTDMASAEPLYPKPFGALQQLQKKVVDAPLVNRTYQKMVVDIESSIKLLVRHFLHQHIACRWLNKNS